MFLKNPVHLSLLIFGTCLLFAQLYSGHIHPYRSFYHEWTMTAGVFVAVIPYFVIAKEKIIVPAIGLLVFALMLWLGLQSLSGITRPAAIYYPVFVLFAMILAMGLGASWVKQTGSAVSLSWMFALVFFVAAILSVLMQQVQILGLDWRPFVMYMSNDGVNPIRAFANVAQPNQLALLICFGIASLWWLLQNSRMPAWLAWCLAVVFLWGLSLTQSRIAWIILPCLTALILLVRRDSHKTSLFGLLSLLFIYVILLISLPTIAKWLGFVVGTLGERVGGRSERTVLLQQAWAMASAHPWFGVGWFNFGPEQVTHASNFSASIYAEHSHNIILNFSAELGIVFTTCFFVILLIFLWKTCGSKRRLEDKSVIFFLMLLLAVGVHSLVEFPLWYAYVLMPVGVILGALHQMRWQHTSLSLSRSVAWITVPTCFAMLVWAWIDFHRVVDGFVAFREEKNYALIPEDKVRAPSWTLMPDFYDYFKLMRMTPVAGLSAEDMKFIETTSKRFGFVHILSKQAEIYVLNGQIDAAKKTMLSLQRLHPWSYPEYYDYWQKLAESDTRFAEVFVEMPARDAQ